MSNAELRASSSTHFARPSPVLPARLLSALPSPLIWRRMAKATYKESGVDLDVYEESMARLPRLLRRTHSPRVLPAEGGFAGCFSSISPSGLFARNYQEPVLVSGTDGVGTKLKVAQLAGVHDTVGIDLVAMCVNDVLCCGAEPLFFLDYVAMAHDDPALLEPIVAGISDGCVESDMALVGGETAIMPDMYQPRRLRPGRLLRRRRRARRRCSTARRSRRATWCSAWRRAGCTRTATAWCGRSCSTSPG